MLKSLVLAAALAAASPTLAQEGGDMTPTTVDVVEAASAAGNLELFLKATMDADLAETLAGASGVTIFAPIDPAFGAVEGFDAIAADKTRLANLLKAHVVPSVYLSGQIPAGETEVQTLAGETLTITNTNGSISVTTPEGTEAMVVRADIRSDNGVVHAVNKVLAP